jgi:hypothetical protein
MQDSAALDPPATHLQIIRVVSRLFAAYMLFWAADELSILPRYILGFTRYFNAGPDLSNLSSTPYLLRSYGFDASSAALKIALLLLAAGWFYRCGPRIQRFFAPEAFPSALAPTSNPEP